MDEQTKQDSEQEAGPDHNEVISQLVQDVHDLKHRVEVLEGGDGDTKKKSKKD